MRNHAGSRILVIDDDESLADTIVVSLRTMGFDVEACYSSSDAEVLLEKDLYSVVVCDYRMPGRSGIELLSTVKRRVGQIPNIVLISGYINPDMVERASKLGVTEVLSKPFSMEELKNVINRLFNRSTDTGLDIIEIMRQVGGLDISPGKRQTVETRIMRRARQLGFGDLEGYYNYFQSHREQEVSELLSHVTTHHTFFFREPEHFDFLEEELFPRAVSMNKPLRIWSAACSTGEEVYTIAICYLEYLRKQRIPFEAAPRLELFGTDIDENTVKLAQKGIYPRGRIERLDPAIVKRYFRFGTGELEAYVKVSDQVYKMCRFSRWNLQSKEIPHRNCDAIFVRNVLIYFSRNAVEEISERLSHGLRPSGFLIMGHSESVAVEGTNLQNMGHSIYQHKGVPGNSLEAGVTRLSSKSSRTDKQIGVFIVDDSPTIRAILKKIVNDTTNFKFLGEAENPVDAGPQIAALRPDVVTLDINMPKMDGVTYLRSIDLYTHPPVVVISSISEKDAEGGVSCLELGAAAYIEKPDGGNIVEKSESIREAIEAAARYIRIKPVKEVPSKHNELVNYKLSRRDLLAIGASTGGVIALREVLTKFPQVTPPILIVQHIPKMFSKTFANRLNSLCAIKVSEATDGEIIEASHAYIAPGGYQMGIVRCSQGLRIAITDHERVNRHKPSVDYLFEAIAQEASDCQISAALLTGMGADGARGLLALKKMGAHTIAQDEISSVVFGMPKAAIDIDAHCEIVSLSRISNHLFRSLAKSRIAS